jgi:dihydroorotase
MKLLIQQACIQDPRSPHHGTIQDILIENGIIREIAPGISDKGDRQIARKGLQVSTGWVDPFANFADPGYEFKESLETGAAAAAAGGYTDVFLIPDTKPVIDSKSQVEYIRQKSHSLPATLWPIGAITKNLEGKHLAEMYDMQQSGAVAFTDGLHPVQAAGVLLKALQYVKAFEGVIIQIPDDASIAANGIMNEGVVSTRLGLPGKPMMAEELIIARDIKLARYTDSKIHFTGVSSPKSLEYIRRAKDSGLSVTCSVTPYHLFFSDQDLVDYDSNLKVFPPLRNEQAVRELRTALLDGTIDCIATHHLPQEYDSKVLEFEYAKYGMTGLETSYAVIQTLFPSIQAARIAELFSSNARKIFNLPAPVIQKDAAVVLTLFDPAAKWTFDLKDRKSKSANTAFAGQSFTGSSLGTIRGEKIWLNHENWKAI